MPSPNPTDSLRRPSVSCRLTLWQCTRAPVGWELTGVAAALSLWPMSKSIVGSWEPRTRPPQLLVVPSLCSCSTEHILGTVHAQSHRPSRLDAHCCHRPKSLTLIAETSVLIGSAGSTTILPPALLLGNPKVQEDLLVLSRVRPRPPRMLSYL